jgi:hypothetical protein
LGKGLRGGYATPEGYPLMAEAETTRDFDLARSSQLAGLHPNIIFGRPGGCETCQMLWAKATPYASTDDIRDAFAFDLSCIGSTLRRCTDMSQILPVAARREKEDWNAATQTMRGVFAWLLPAALRRCGRDAKLIAVAEITEVYPKQSDDQGNDTQRVSLSTIETLKGQTTVPSQPVTFYLRHSQSPETANSLRPALHQKLITFWGVHVSTPWIAPVTDENLEEVRAGIAEDAVDIPRHW